MKGWDAQRIAIAAGADLLTSATATTDGSATVTSDGPTSVTIDSREAGPGVLFVGLPGERAHGGAFAADALAAGAWGVLTDLGHARQLDGGVVLAAEDPLRALQQLATAWRIELGASSGLQVIGVTGSTGKTSTKDLLLAVLSPHRVTTASRANFNTEIGLPLELLRTPAGTELLILEMGMRGAGQIAELTAIALPDVAVIVSIGPVHLELLGSIAAIAAAKAELIAGLAPGATAVIPVDEPLLTPHLRQDLSTVTFGTGGDVAVKSETDDRVEIVASGAPISLAVDFTQAHLRRNLLAAVAAACAVGVTPQGTVTLALSPGRGQHVELAGGITLLDDSYNANPMSMRAALDELAATARRAGGRRAIAVLGDMLELGPAAVSFHREIGAYAAARADMLVTVGPLAAAMDGGFPHEHHHVADAGAAAELLSELVHDGDVVLVKASRGVHLEVVCAALSATGRTGATA
jgi:UDP-N-acetylmuramoyl-tripeptide--D-alanyl-D-alanine ligase